MNVKQNIERNIVTSVVATRANMILYDHEINKF